MLEVPLLRDRGARYLTGDNLRVANSAQRTSELSPILYRAPWSQERGTVSISAITQKLFGQSVCNSNFACVALPHSKCMARLQPLLELKTQPRFHSVS